MDLLFANRAEMCSLYEVDDVEEAVSRVRRHCEVAAVTLSERGSLIVTADERHEVPAWSTGVIVDTTGAGDQDSPPASWRGSPEASRWGTAAGWARWRRARSSPMSVPVRCRPLSDLAASQGLA